MQDNTFKMDKSFAVNSTHSEGIIDDFDEKIKPTYKQDVVLKFGVADLRKRRFTSWKTIEKVCVRNTMIMIIAPMQSHPTIQFSLITNPLITSSFSKLCSSFWVTGSPNMLFLRSFTIIFLQMLVTFWDLMFSGLNFLYFFVRVRVFCW